MAEMLPKSGRSARFALRAMAVMWLLAAAFCGFAIFRLNRHGFTEYIFAYLVCAGVGCLLASFLLSYGLRVARIVTWMVLPLCLMFFPIGPALAIYTAINLESAEMKKFFKRRQDAAPAQADQPPPAP